MSEVKTYQVIGYLVKGKSLGRINVVSLSDYDALAAQRDEGLAREAQKNLVIDGLSLENQAAQQLLAKAKELLRGLKQNGPHAFNMSTGLSVQDNIDAFLASPCCTDGEKS